MVESVAKVRSKRLQRQRTPEDYRLYKAALEWGLPDPAVIASEGDIKSERRWRGYIAPSSQHISNLMTFCQQLPATLLADEVGLGNAVSAGLVASELLARGRIAKLLIVCPRVLIAEWRQILEAKFRIPAKVVFGRDLIYDEANEGGAVITTYHSAWMYLDKIPANRFDLLVLDEADKLRHLLRNLRGADNPAQIPAAFRDALEKHRFRYVLMTTTRLMQTSLWDLYYLIDLVATARGHVNPFGSENAFALKFVADKRDEARQLKPAMREEFHDTVSRYVTRTRREDVKLNFPDRIVQPIQVEPNAKERELIELLAKPIQNLEPAAQMPLLFALTSSPNAVLAEVNALARAGVLTEDVAVAVRVIIGRMPLSAKLEGLTTIIDRLRLTTPEGWRVAVFTGSIETQKRIETYLDGRGIAVGAIGNMADHRDQETLARFRKPSPDVRVIVCTEIDSGILDLPTSTSIVNYDLPWDPVLVERRAGQFHRLLSARGRLNIFNLTLGGTFEEQVVSRLIGRLQSASRAMEDVEPLLHAAGLGSDDDGDTGFDGWILQLVLASFAGKDVESVIRQIEQNIAAARTELAREEQEIAALLGSMSAAEQGRPRVPSLPPAMRTMEADEFAFSALQRLGAKLTPQADQIYLSEHDEIREQVTFAEDSAAVPGNVVRYAPGSQAFAQLAAETAAIGVHLVNDVDEQAEQQTNQIAQHWVSDFGATLLRSELLDVCRSFDGTALAQVRAAVAADSYERLVEIPCSANDHSVWSGRSGLAPISEDIQDGAAVGIDGEVLFQAAIKDSAIAEFCRFYKARRQQEVSGGGADPEKRQELADDLTPEFTVMLVSLRGAVHRQLKLRVHYKWDHAAKYTSTLTVAPYFGMVVEAPPLDRCAATGTLVPEDCLAACEITGAKAIRHCLMRSQLSGRLALPENIVVCNLSKQRVLIDEAQLSDASNQIVARPLLKSSAVSGKLAEPVQFGECEFTNTEALLAELGISQISGKRYRLDQEIRSVVSGKAGHWSEFVLCEVSRQPFAPDEGVNCDVTGRLADPNVLMRCSVSGKAVIPSELEQCAASGNRALKKYFVSSSISGVRLLERFALRSAKGKFCTPLEGKRCMWSGRKYHPDDLRTCALTGVAVHFKFVTSDGGVSLRPLTDLLFGMRRTADASDLWESIAAKASAALGGGRCRLEAAQTSPDGRHLAVVSEVRSFLGRSVQQAGLLYSFSEDQIVGRIALGKRSSNGWTTA